MELLKILSPSDDRCSATQQPLKYGWDFGDGNTNTGVRVTHQYSTYGKKTVKLKVQNSGLKTSEDTIEVIVNIPPTANDDSLAVNEDSTNNQINVLANDNDPDGDTLRITSVTQPAHGASSADGSYVYYTPNITYICQIR